MVKYQGLFLTTTTQQARNISGIFAECFLNVVMFWTSREHLREHFQGKYFLTNSRRKSCLCVKMYDLTKTNVDLLANSSNHKTMFPEYLKNIPRISVSKIFQGYPQNFVRL